MAGRSTRVDVTNRGKMSTPLPWNLCHRIGSQWADDRPTGSRLFPGLGCEGDRTRLDREESPTEEDSRRQSRNASVPIHTRGCDVGSRSRWPVGGGGPTGVASHPSVRLRLQPSRVETADLSTSRALRRVCLRLKTEAV